MKGLTIIICTLAINLINTQSNISTDYQCSSTKPTTATDCHSNNTSPSDFCCYLSGVQLFANTKLCLNIPKDSYNGDSQYNYNGVTYNISCPNSGSSSKTILKSCGPSDATGSMDCSTGSSFVNSCCYNSLKDLSPVGCYSLGSKFEGKTKWAGLELECNSKYITFSSVLIIILISILF